MLEEDTDPERCLNLVKLEAYLSKCIKFYFPGRDSIAAVAQEEVEETEDEEEFGYK